MSVMKSKSECVDTQGDGGSTHVHRAGVTIVGFIIVFLEVRVHQGPFGADSVAGIVVQHLLEQIYTVPVQRRNV